jgi:hypothetical protein
VLSEFAFLLSRSEFLSCDISTDVQLLFFQVLCQVGTPILPTRIMIAVINNDCSEMDADDLRNFEDQFSDVPPRSTVKFGPYARFLANMPDWINMSQDDFTKAFAALSLPLAGPSPPCCLIHEAIQARISIFRYNVTPHTFISYLISYSISYLIYANLISYPILHLIYVSLISYTMSGQMSYMIFSTGQIGSTLG